MKNHKSLIVLTGVAFILTTAIFLINSSPAVAAEKCHIITIFDRGNMSTNTMNVQKGDCVLWMNWKRSEDVALSFKNGAKCIKAVKSQVGFSMDQPSGCFIAQDLKYGQTVSLVFTEPGTYEYDVSFQVGGKMSARVIVSE